MPDYTLDTTKRNELDSNVREMLKSGASENDVLKYSEDFGKMFGKKKDGSTVSPVSPSPSESPSQKKARHNQTFQSDAQSLEANYKAGLDQAFQQRSQFGGIDMFGVSQFQQSREGKAGKIVADFQSKGTASKEDIKYLNAVAPKAAAQIVFNGTPEPVKQKIQKTGKVDDADIESFNQNHKQIVGDNILLNTAKFYSDQNKNLVSALTNIPGFDPNMASDPKYLNNFYKSISASKTKELAALDAKFPEKVIPSGVASITVRENGKEYEALRKEINDRYAKSFDAVGRLAASKIATPDKDPLEIGLEYLRFADPNRYSVRVKAGRSGIDRDIAAVGSQLQYANNTDLNQLKNVKASGDNLDSRFPDKLIAETKRRLGAELYKSDNWFLNFSPSVNELDEAAKQLPEKNREAYYKYIRDTEQRIIGTDIPQSGAINQLGMGVMSTVEGTNNFLASKVGARGESDIAKDALNAPNKTRFEAAGAGQAEMARIKELDNKVKSGSTLTVDELEEKRDLETYTNIRSTGQKVIDGSFNLGGQVLFQGLGTKGLAGLGTAAVRSAGLLKTAIPTGLATEEAIASSVMNFGISQSQIANIAGAMVAYSSSYDGAAQEAIQMYPDDKNKRDIYTKVVSYLNAGTERLFKDEKIFDAFKRTVRPNIGNLVNEIATGKLTKELLQPTLTKIVNDGLKIVGQTGVENLKETTEEVATSVGTSLTKLLLSPEKFNYSEAVDDAVTTATTMFTDGGLVALVAGVKGYRQNKVGIGVLSKLGVDKTFTADVKSVINAQLLNGDITKEEADKKINVINKIVETNTVDMPRVNALAKISDTASKKYGIALAHEKLLKQELDATTDEALKSKIQDDIKASENIRKSILNKEVFIDDNYAVVTPEEAAKSAQELSNIVSLTPEQKAPPGKRLFNDPNPEAATIETEFKKSKGIDTPEPAPITKLDEEKSKTIADAYDQLVDSPDDPEVQSAYQAMADETMEQFNAIEKSGVKVEIWTGQGEPYKNSAEMIADVRDNKHMYIFSTEEGFGDTPITDKQRQQNALLRDSGAKDVNGKPLLINDVFRFVHDYFGHTRLGNSFGAIGEENAWNVHARMYSPLARRAMTTETRGQNSWVNFNKSYRNADGTMKKKGDPGYVPPAQRPFAEQKMALLPEEFSNIEDNYSLKSDIDVSVSNDSTGFADQMASAKNSLGSSGNSVTPYRQSEYDKIASEGGKFLRAAGNKILALLKPNGEMVSLVKDATVKTKGAAQAMISKMKDMGGLFMDNYDIYLTPIYEKAGYKVVARVPFNEEFAPEGWNAEDSPLKNKPDVVFMVRNDIAPAEEKFFTDGDEAQRYTQSLVDKAVKDGVAKLPSQVDSINKGLTGAIQKAVKSLEKAGIKFNVVDSATDTDAAKAARGNQALFMSDDGTIIIDRSKLQNDIEAGLVVWHEASHPVMNIIRNTNKPLYDAVVRGINEAAKKNEGVKGAVDWAQSQEQYDNEDTQNDEAIVETIGRINAGLIDVSTLDTGLRQQLVDFVNSIAKFFGIDPILNDTDLASFKKTVSEVADALKTGRDIGEIVGQENVGKFKAASIQARSIAEMKDNQVEKLVSPGVKVSTRIPTAAGSPKDVHSSNQYIIDLKSQRESPVNYLNNALEIASYPVITGVKKSDIAAIKRGLLPKSKGGNEIDQKKAMKIADDIYSKFVRSVADNLVWLHDQFDENLRLISRRWYDGANKIAQDFSQKFGVSVEQASAVIASLSPQMDWYKNVSLAERVLDIVKNKRDFIFDDKMAAKYVLIAGNVQKGKNETKEAMLVRKAKLIEQAKKDVEILKGNRLDAMPEFFPKALRAYDEVYNDKSYDILSPNAEVIGKAKTKKGNNAKIGWQGYATIAKAISIAEDGSPENISRQLGEMHKVRNFNNNIVDPNSDKGDVTIDTHAVAAGLMKPLAGSDSEVEANLSGKSSAETGSTGTYAAFADAYRLAAKEKGILPRQMQSITWEAVRGLFTDRFKSDKANKKKINEIWDQFAQDKIDINETRRQINEAAGGVRTPSWARSGDQALIEDGATDNEKELSGAGAMGDGTGTGRGDSSVGEADMVRPAAQPSVGNRNLAPNGKPSNLNEKQYQQVRTPEFKNWFGDWENDTANASKVVDENGEPLVVYHNSLFNNIEEFKGYVTYFTDSKEYAKTFKGIEFPNETQYEAYLNIRNPYNSAKPIADVPEEVFKEGNVVAPRLVKKFFGSGFDGLIGVDAGQTKGKTYVSFNPNQIKSATGNSGAFSTTDNRIQASVGNRSEDDLRAPGTGKERDRALSSRFGSLDPQTQAKIEDDAITYFQKTNKQTAKAVEEFIDGQNLIDMADYVLSKPDIPEVSKVWMAAEVARRMNAEIAAAKSAGNQPLVDALIDKQSAIYNDFAKQATSLGQAVQAFIAFKSDPNAVDFFLPKILKQLKKAGADNVTEEQKADIVNLLRDVNSAADGLPKDKAIIKMSHYLAGIAPMKPMDVLQALWYAKILSGITTQSTNFFANVFNTAFELPAVAARIAIMNKAPLSLAAGVKGFASGIVKGSVAAADIIKTGVRSKEVDKYFAESPLEYFTWSKWLGKTGKAMDYIPPINFGAWKYIGRMLAATDALFSTANQEAIANMLAYAEAAGTPGNNNFRKANALLGNTKQNIDNAKAQAKAEGFDPKSLQGRRRVIEIVAQGRKGTDEADAIGKRITMNYDPEGWTKPLFDATVALQRSFPIIKMVIPFARIVANLTENGLNYSPLGLVRAATGRRNPIFDNSRDKLSTEERVDLFNKFALGMTALVALAAVTGEDDDDWFEITAGGSNDVQKKYELQKGGWRPYTITLKDGTKINYKDWPIAGILAGIGHIRDAKKYTFDDSTQMSLYATGFFLNFYDKSLVSGLNDFFGMIHPTLGRGKYAPDTNMSDRAKKYAAQQVRSVAVSNLSQQAGKMYSELVTGDPQRDAKTFAEVIYRDLPMFNDGIRPIIDVFGDDVKYNTTERLTPKFSAESDELVKWLNENKLFVGVPQKKNIIAADGSERPMTDEEYYEYRKIAGKETKNMIKEFMEGIAYPDRQIKEKMFDAAKKTARDVAYITILEKYGFK